MSSILQTVVKNKILLKIFGDSSWLLTANSVSIVSGILQMGMIARLIGPEGIGVIGLFISANGLIQGLLTLKSAELILTFTTRYDSTGDKIRAKNIIAYSFLVDFITSFAAYIIIVLGSLFFFNLFDISQEYKCLFVLYSLVTIITAPTVSGNALLRFRNLFKLNLVVSIISSAAKLLFTSFLFFKKAEFSDIIWIYILGSLIEGILIFYFSIRGLNVFRGINVIKVLKENTKDKEIFNFQFQGYGRSVVKFLSRYADMLIIGLFGGSTTQIGFYRAAKQVANYIQVPINSLAAGIMPEFSKLFYSKRLFELKSVIKHMMIVFITLSVIIFLVISLFHEQITILLFGSKFIGAGGVLLIVILSAIINIIMTPIYSLPIITGNAKPALISSAIALVFQLAAIWFLVPNFQAIGAAWASVIYMLVWCFILLFYIYPIYKSLKNENSLSII